VELPEVGTGPSDDEGSDDALRPKNSKSTIELNEKDLKLLLASQDEFKLKAVIEILEQKLVKRHVPLKAADLRSGDDGCGSTVRQEITLQQGHPDREAREIVKLVKIAKKKVQASIQGDFVRVERARPRRAPGVIQLLKAHDFGIDTQFPITARSEGWPADRVAQWSRGRRAGWRRCSRSRKSGEATEAALVCHAAPGARRHEHNKVVYGWPRPAPVGRPWCCGFNYRG